METLESGNFRKHLCTLVLLGAANLAVADDASISGFRFSPTTPEITFDLQVDLPEGTVVTGHWIAVDVGDAAPANFEIAATDVVHQAGSTISYTLSMPSAGWPAGEYVLRITTDEPIHDANFTISSE